MNLRIPVYVHGNMNIIYGIGYRSIIGGVRTTVNINVRLYHWTTQGFILFYRFIIVSLFPNVCRIGKYIGEIKLLIYMVIFL